MTLLDRITDLEAKAKAATPGPWLNKRCNDDALIVEDGDSTGWKRDYPMSYIAKAGGWGYAFHKNPDFIAAANPTVILDLCTKLRKAVEALEFYSGLKSGEWIKHVCDSYSGENAIFDWPGDIQDEPYDIARAALKEIARD